MCIEISIWLLAGIVINIKWNIQIVRNSYHATNEMNKNEENHEIERIIIGYFL